MTITTTKSKIKKPAFELTGPWITSLENAAYEFNSDIGERVDSVSGFRKAPSL